MPYIGADAQGIIASIDGGTIKNATLDSTVTFPAAHLVQVKTATTDQVDSFNTSGFQDVAGLSVDITPKLGSKILIYVEFRYGNSTSSNNGVQLLRNSDVLDLGGSNSTNLGNVNSVLFMDTSFTYYDSPNTDQQITYKLQVQRSAGTLYINGRSDGSNDRNGTIVAMEIV
jgi:hypothetical protein